MKKNIERILFMVIGALIAICTYMFGHIDNSANAQQANKIGEYDVIRVKTGIVLGGGEKGKLSAALFISESIDMCTLSLGISDGKGSILMNDNLAHISVGKNTDPIINLVFKNGNSIGLQNTPEGEPSIILSNKSTENKRLITSEHP